MGNTLRKTSIPKTPSIFYRYNIYIDRKELTKKLIFPKGIKSELKNWKTEFVKEFFDTFREAGVTSRVYRYELGIDI